MHIETHELWIQDAVDKRRLELVKIKHKYNPADILTKYLPREDMERILDGLNHTFEQGRSDVAPDLSMLELQSMMSFVLEKYDIKNYAV